MFDLRPSKIPGCSEIQPRVAEDARGRFVKFFHRDAFQALGLETGFVEEYYSVSYEDVVRGMHFQLPPHDHAKLVFCTSGAVFDAVLDLRVGSPTYGRFDTFELTASKGNCVYIASGMAHGFCVRQAPATMIYLVSTMYAPESDSGIRWDSVGIEWPTARPVVSERDRSFPDLASFKSPFRYG